jgi:hypothetical protein
LKVIPRQLKLFPEFQTPGCHIVNPLEIQHKLEN